jgi:hypothetical protein
MTNLNIIYGAGFGVPKNQLRSYVWTSLSDTLGGNTTMSDLKAKYSLTPEQLATGQDLATKCFESDFKDCPF